MFFDSRFSANGAVSCATCHRPELGFTDPLPRAHGLATTTRRTMPLIGLAYQSWFSGTAERTACGPRRLLLLRIPLNTDLPVRPARGSSTSYTTGNMRSYSARSPISPMRHALSGRPATDDPLADALWNSMGLNVRNEVNRIYANMGKAIGAFVRLIVPTPSRFDGAVESLLGGDGNGMDKGLTKEELQGLRLFIGKAKCVNCHNGPLLTSGDFHNVGDLSVRPIFRTDRGRAEGIGLVRCRRVQLSREIQRRRAEGLCRAPLYGHRDGAVHRVPSRLPLSGTWRTVRLTCMPARSARSGMSCCITAA
ncbi:MAG: hypothetical protein MZU95_12335 [Desulfomicrobium escambiense]|nr:hypothetical protein [Desulfomicrobium escambiense]